MRGWSGFGGARAARGKFGRGCACVSASARARPPSRAGSRARAPERQGAPAGQCEVAAAAARSSGINMATSLHEGPTNQLDLLIRAGKGAAGGPGRAAGRGKAQGGCRGGRKELRTLLALPRGRHWSNGGRTNPGSDHLGVACLR